MKFNVITTIAVFVALASAAPTATSEVEARSHGVLRRGGDDWNHAPVLKRIPGSPVVARSKPSPSPYWRRSV
ncbi:hypothetical protein BKA62DRAFT_771600 [Auriculariales sp. MPI-PUGE-AT-0066]|nr:hypothetical protein BKA62DRAFT_771600 [Auriculariales sp. MPI-PUGE-AT-0066]